MAAIVTDFTRGSIRRQLIQFSAPFFLTNLIQSFYNIADIKIVDMFCGTEGVAGASIAGSPLNTITYMIVGLCNGGAIMTAQYIGAKNGRGVRETVGTTFAVMLALAAVTTALALIFARQILSALNTPADAFDETLSYFTVCMAGSVFIYAYNAVGSILRGAGNSKIPMYFGAASCAMNILLDLLFVGPFGMGVAGAALATVMSQAAAAIGAAAYLFKSGFFSGFGGGLLFSAGKLGDIFRLGLPGAIQNMIVSGGFLMVSSITNSLGTNAASGVSVAAKINNFAQLPAGAVGMAVSSMTGQNVGAGLYDRARKAFSTAVQLALIVGAVMFVIVQLFPAQLMGLIISDEAVITEAVPYLRITCFDYLLVALVFPINGILNGSGHTLFTMLPSVVSSVIARVPVAFFCTKVLGMGIAGVGLSTPTGTISAILIGGWFYLTNRWTRRTIKVET